MGTHLKMLRSKRHDPGVRLENTVPDAFPRDTKNTVLHGVLESIRFKLKLDSGQFLEDT
jgi:hypothetical protein